MTAIAERAASPWDTAPPVRDGDPVIEQRIGGDLALAVFRCKSHNERYYVLAFDAEGGYLSRIATVYGQINIPAVWKTAIPAARQLYPEHASRRFE